MKKILLFAVLLISIHAFAQEGTKQFMPNSNDRLWIEFGVFDGNNFGLYDCSEKERINIYLKAGEKMYFGMKINTEVYSSDVYTDYRFRSFRIKDPSGNEVFPEQRIVTTGEAGYIDNYTEAVTGPNGAILNGTTISSGYVPLVYTATTTGNHYIEFASWRYNFDTYGSASPNEYRFRRFALEYFDVTVTDATNHIITNPGEPNKSAGRLWSKGWTFTNTSFDDYRVNAHFYVFTSDEFINKVNFQMYPYSFTFVVNSYGITTYTEENYIKRTQSLDGDQTSGDDISEYKVFLNDPDRIVWPNTLLIPPKVKVWTEDTLFFDYNYNRNPLTIDLGHDKVFMEKNRVDSCDKEDVAIFKIESSIDGFTAILIDIDKDGVYSTGGSDRVIYRNMKKGLNYILWDFKTDGDAIVAVGDYTASATFLGRGPAHFPLYDVEQMDGIITSSIRPFNKLNTSLYWDDTQITTWGDQDGGDLMDETQRQQLVIEDNVPRTWSWHSDLSGTPHNGNMNTLNTWFNAIDLGYPDIGLHVEQSLTKCVDGLAPWVGDIYMEGPKNNDIVFDTLDFTYKFFDPREYLLSSVQIISLPQHGTLKLSSVNVSVNQTITKANLPNLTYTPDADWFGKDSIQWKGNNGISWSNNQENIYFIINTPPVISSIADTTLCTNQTVALPFTITDDENDINTIELTGFSADPNFVPNAGVVIGGTGANRTVTVTPVANKSGQAIIYIMADDGLSQVIQQFTVYVGPDLEFSGDTTVCVGDDLYLIAQETGATSYTWKYNTTTISTTQSVTQLAGSVNVGQWALTIVKDECTSTRYFTVSVSPLTTFTGDVDVCVGDPISLSATEVNASYIWKKGTTTVASTKIFSIPSAATTNAGTDYTLFVDKNGCQNISAPFTITVKNLPSTSLTVSGNTVDPGVNGTITINSAQTDITYNVYQGTNLVASGSGTGVNLGIEIPSAYLTIGDNIFTIKADNENCEKELTNKPTIHVNTPGFTVSSISGHTSESGTTATYTIMLNTKPSADVTIAISSNDLSEGTVSPSTLTFNTTNYNLNQTVTVTGVDDFIIDGNVSFSVINDAAVSGDVNYNGLKPNDVTVINDDNDVAAVIVSPINGLTTSEAGATTQFTIILSSQPSADVTITLSSDNTDEGTVSDATVTFTSGDWNVAKTITVTGVDDLIDDDNQIYNIITSLTSSTDPNYNGLLVSDVEITNIDNDDAGITVSPTAGLVTTELGGTAQFTIVLNTEPVANVSIGISSGDLSEGTVSLSNITFTPSNWDTPQLITITGVNDNIDDGDVSYSIITDAAISTDVKYNGINPLNVSVTNTDDDVAGITVSPTSGLTTTEGGGQATFNIALNTQPTADVTIGISSSNTSEGTVSPTSVTFTSGNWNTNQTITITGVDDYVVDGNASYTIITAAAISADGNYNTMNPLDVSVNNNDNDVAGVTVSPISIGTTEGGGTAIISFELTSQPTNNVTISLSGIDATEGSIDKSTLIFTSGNWNLTQDVTVTGLDDAIQDGNINYTITTIASSSDVLYNGIPVSDISVTNADDDIAGITVSPTSGLTTNEGGGQATFTVALNTQPTNDVTISISSSDLTEGTVSSASVTFTNSDWAVKTITITGVDDQVDDGNIPYTIVTSNSSSADPNYNNISVDDVLVTNIDNDVSGITVTPTSGLTTTEAGGQATFTVILTSQPTANVIIGLSSDDTSEGTVSTSSLTFTSKNWNTAQIVTITGVNDDVDDGDVTYNIVTALATSGDANYNNLNANNVSVTNTDDDTAGITVTPISGLTTTEAGGTATFTIVLNTQPTNSVTIGLSSSNTAEGTISPSSLTFTTGNWNSAQTVTITGVNDFVDDGDISYIISTNAASSSDVNYNGVDALDVSVTNIDDDEAGITVNPTSGLTTTEAGGTAAFTVRLNSRPTSNVVIGISSSDITEGTVSASSLTFTTTNWNANQTVTITGVNDFVDDEDINYNIITALATSSDANYNTFNASDVSVTNIDDDVAGIIVTPTSGLTTTEAGGTATFTVVLNSQPTANVTIGLSSSNTSEGTISTSSLVFSTSNWNSAQTVTITGVDDFVDDGDIAYTIITSPSTSSDGKYNGINASDISVTNIDNDIAGITVNATAGLYTREDGAQITFTVKLNSQPTDDVTIDLSSNDLTEGTINKSTLTFTSLNWDTNQIITTTGVDDDIDDGDIAYAIITQPAVSSDLKYNGLNPADVSLTNQDDDIAGITVTPANLTINENGSGQNFTIVLNTEPTDNVTIGISSNNTDKGTVSVASLIFAPSNWDSPQTVTVYPVDNFIDDGDISFSIVTAIAISNDDNYKNRNASDVSVTSIDDDVAGINVSAITGNTSEDLTSVTFTIVLNSKPTDDVTIDINSTNTGEGTVSPTSVTFSSLDWNVAQTVTVTGVNDAVADGNQTYYITLDAAVSLDPNYDGLDPDDIEVINADNDSPGITVFPINGLTTNEAGGQATFTIVLNSQPTNDVMIALSSDDISEGTVSPASVTFIGGAAGDWNTPQTVTITGLDDTDNDGDILYSIVTTNAASSDVAYNNLVVQDVFVTNMDDITPRLTDDADFTDEDHSVNINVLANDKGLDDGGLIVSISSQPSHGIVNIETDNSITYIPDGLFNGDDTFNYRVCDGENDCDEATVTVTVSWVDDLPVAISDSRGTSKNTDVLVNVLFNDYGLEDDGIAVSIDEAPNVLEGSVLIVGDEIRFTPAVDYIGLSSFIYKITDTDGDADTAIVTINVREINHVPIAVDDHIETQINTSVDISVLANDSGFEDGFGSLSINQIPAHGNVIINSSRSITYTPTVGYLGMDSFDYLITDSDGDYDIATVSITVNDISDSHPVAVDDSRATNYETPVTINVIANDINLDDGVLSVTISSEPVNGSYVVNPDFTITYTPNSGYSGTENFGYQVCDTDGDCATATITVIVLPNGVTNHLPVATDDATSTLVNTPVDIDILSNDTGLEDGFGQIIIFEAPQHGSVIVNTNRTITYTPSNLFIGEDSFRYWVEDIHGDYSIATVTVTVSDTPDYQPIANDDARGTAYETAVKVDVLTNDTGLEDGGLLVTILSAPNVLEGIAVVINDTIVFTPAAGYSGVSTFEYTVTDADGDSDNARVMITVLADGITNHLPIAADDATSTLVNTSVDIDILSNDTGLEDGFGQIIIFEAPQHGSVIVNTNRTIRYTPSNLFIGDDSFRYWVEDIHGDYSIATVTVTVSDTPDYHPIANDDARGTEYETAVKVDVLTNDTGLEDGGLIVTILSAPNVLEGTAVVINDTIVFTPAVGYSGLSTFEYTVTDVDGDSDNARVKITVLADGVTNHLPVATDDATSTLVNTPVDIDVLSNDTGLEDGFGQIIIFEAPQHGSVIVNTNRTITYTPSNLFIGDDSFRYWVEDIHGDYSIATVTVTVSDTPDYQPIANDDARGTEYETAVKVDVLTNDTGLEDGGLIVTILSAPNVLEGTAVVINDTIVFTPAVGYSGLSTFEYTVTDADGDSDNARVMITVLADGVTNHLPVATDDATSTLVNTPVDIDVLSNDTGLEDGFGQIIIFEAPQHGSVIVNTNRTITYTPSNLFIGEDSFRYWVEDIHGDYSIATVTVTVSDTPDYQPIANDDARGTAYETAVEVDVLTNDTGLEDGGLIVTILSAPNVLEGTAVVINDTIVFTPAVGYSGLSTFEYTVTDADGDSDNARVMITVLADGVTNHLPVATDDATSTLVNTPVDIDVLSNDTGLEDGFGQIIIFEAPQHGSVIVNTNRTITYTPSNLFIGDDSFRYWVEDIHGDYSIATVTVTVSDTPDYQPIANDDARGTEYETAVKVDVLTNDTGLEDGGLIVTILSAPNVLEGTAVVVNDTIVFTPAAGYSGVSTFEYTVTDADGDSDNARVRITVLADGVTNHLPVATDDATSTLVNTSVDIDVLSNDTGLEDGFGQIIIFEAPQHGSVIVNTNRTIRYTPSNLFIGDDSFRYWVEDIHGDYSIATVTVTVSDTPDYHPIANDDARGTEYETAVIVDVLTNDKGLEDGGLVLTIESDPSQGTTSINSNNTITYTPANSFSGVISFQYRVTDADGDFSVANVVITVKADGVINYIPTANDDHVETLENTAVDINVLANDAGLEDGFGQIIIFKDPDYGSVIINANRTITYTPSAWFIGDDSFEYWVEDVDGDYDIATVDVSVVKEGNIVPEAFDDARGTEYETTVIVDVLTNDKGLDDGGILVNIESAPSNGDAIVNGDNTVSYTPSSGFSGVDYFAYKVTDVDGDYDIANVTITVKEDGVTNHIPHAFDDNVETLENTDVDINILSNDLGLEDGFGQIIIFTQPVNGTVVVNTNRTITYTPANAFIGSDSLNYWIEDVDGDYDIATVYIQVSLKPNYIPVANDDRRGASFNTAVNIDVLINDSGLEDGGIVVSIETSPNSEQGTSVANVDNTVTFTPKSGFIGEASFTYKVEDKDGDFDVATVTINVREGVNIVPNASNDYLETIMDQSVTSNILANDIGLNEGIGKVIIFAEPMHGSVVVNDNYTITYQPDAWFVGDDELKYWIEDVDGDYDTATVYITVNPLQNNIPVANDDSRGTSLNTNVTVDVLVNDTGLEDGGIIVTKDSDPLHGSVTINADNTITYTPENGYLGSDQFTYRVCDKDNDCDVANVTINVRETNHIPLAVDDKFYTNVNTTKTIDILSNDSGLDDGGITIKILSQIIVGSVVVNDYNTITYIPLTGYEGTDYFAYMVSDMDGDYDVGMVTMEVMTGVLPGVSISDISGNTSENGSTSTFTVVLNNQPTSDVFVDLTSNDLTEGTVSDSRLTFTSTNWDVSQTVTVTGIDDYIDDGDIAYKILVDNVVSTDLSYNGLSLSNVDLVNIDDDEAGIYVLTGINQTSEDRTETYIKLVLNSQPLADVSIEMSSDDISEGSLDLTDLLFTSENWSDTIRVVVAGQDDNEVDGDINYNIIISPTVSNDPKYNGLLTEAFSLTNIDNDSKDLIIPDAFSPGTDDFNDFFRIVNLEHYDRASIRVYNRWGSLVFSDDHYQNNWDGKGNVGSSLGSELPMGTYYYILEIKDTDEKKSGYVFIKR